MSERKVDSALLAGILFIVGGAAFFMAAWLGDQPAFFGVGATFFAVGAVMLSRARRGGPS